MPEHEAPIQAFYDHETDEPRATGRRRRQVADWGVGEDVFDRLPSRRFARADRRGEDAREHRHADAAGLAARDDPGRRSEPAPRRPRRRPAADWLAEVSPRPADEPGREPEGRRTIVIGGAVEDEIAPADYAERASVIGDEMARAGYAERAGVVGGEIARGGHVERASVGGEIARAGYAERAGVVGGEIARGGHVERASVVGGEIARGEYADRASVISGAWEDEIVPAAGAGDETQIAGPGAGARGDSPSQARPRRTIVIGGHPDRLPAPRPRRPPKTALERVGASPDRLAAYAVGLGLLLILIAVLTTSH